MERRVNEISFFKEQVDWFGAGAAIVKSYRKSARRDLRKASRWPHQQNPHRTSPGARSISGRSSVGSPAGSGRTTRATRSTPGWGTCSVPRAQPMPAPDSPARRRAAEGETVGCIRSARVAQQPSFFMSSLCLNILHHQNFVHPLFVPACVARALLGAIRDAWWSVVRRVPGIPPLGLGYQLDPGY